MEVRVSLCKLNEKVAHAVKLIRAIKLLRIRFGGDSEGLGMPPIWGGEKVQGRGEFYFKSLKIKYIK